MSRAPRALALERKRISVRGVVQGVGFRPFVYGLAHELALAGFVRNVEGGVAIEVEGEIEALAHFERRLTSEAPPLSRPTDVASTAISARGEAGFAILASEAGANRWTPVTPDTAPCEACLAELFDPADRRFGYPFLNCTHCGPRFTLVADVPYDRPNTTMRGFELCAACAAEYRDPRDRRFHAQPTACPRCGPSLHWVDPARPSETLHGAAALEAARAAVAAGLIVALKGIGGFHLACDATSESAVTRLRERKGRGEKPFASMAASLEIVRRYAEVSAEEATLLASPERPIVLLRRRANAATPAPRLARSVAPGQAHLGFLLPYSPLHALLLGDLPWVMTSGNRSEEPIARDNDEALARLASIADRFLLHDRPIEVVCDDSVVRVFRRRALPIRRSRGYVPLAVPLPPSLPGGAAGREPASVLAVGGELKAVFCLTRERSALLSQHLGDMENLETLAAAERALDHFRRLFRPRPERVVCDLHPAYLSARWADEIARREGLPLETVQHHHAHAASVMAENGHSGERKVIAFTFDGTGYGPDGTIWGGEVLLADYSGYERFAHLAPIPLPGGDAAIRHPARVALVHLAAAGLPWHHALPPVRATSAEQRRILARQLAGGFGTVPTTSMGRLFDAVAALLGLARTASYEGQPAMELEAAAAEEDTPPREPAAFTLITSAADDGTRPVVLDPAPVLAELVAGLRDGRPIPRLAVDFHEALARAMLALAERARSRTGLREVALTGGVFQNLRLLGRALELLEAAGFEVLIHRQVPPNDGGLALGQAAVATLGRRELA